MIVTAMPTNGTGNEKSSIAGEHGGTCSPLKPSLHGACDSSKYGKEAVDHMPWQITVAPSELNLVLMWYK
jgi:hypothetical protein